MKVKFVPQNVEFEIKPGQSVMHLAEDNGIYVKSVCRGVPSCAECRIKIVEGEANVFAPAAAELGLIGSGWFIDRRRLSCQLQCMGDVTVDLSEQIAKQQGLIGGRKAKAAKALGDRVEDETVIRDSSTSATRDRDQDEDESAHGGGSDSVPRDSGRGGRRDGPQDGRRDETARGNERPVPPKNNIVIGGPKPAAQIVSQPPGAAGAPAGGGPTPTEPRDQGASRIQPRDPNSPEPPPKDSNRDPAGDEGGRSGRSRRGGRGRR